MLSSTVQPLNTDIQSFEMLEFSVMSTVFSDEQFWNAHEPRDVTLSGIATSLRLEQLRKAELSIVIAKVLSANVSSFKPVQPSNALDLIAVTELGICTDSRAIHFLND